MPNLSLNRLLIFSPNLREACRFYGGILGLPLVGETDGMLLFRHEGFQLAIFECDRDASPDAHSVVAGSCLVFNVESLEAAIAELSAQGVRFLHQEPASGPLGRYVAFTDPFGVVHELSEGAT